MPRALPPALQIAAALTAGEREDTKWGMYRAAGVATACQKEAPSPPTRHHSMSHTEAPSPPTRHHNMICIYTKHALWATAS